MLKYYMEDDERVLEKLRKQKYDEILCMIDTFKKSGNIPKKLHITKEDLNLFKGWISPIKKAKLVTFNNMQIIISKETKVI